MVARGKPEDGYAVLEAVLKLAHVAVGGVFRAVRRDDFAEAKAKPVSRRRLASIDKAVSEAREQIERIEKWMGIVRAQGPQRRKLAQRQRRRANGSVRRKGKRRSG